jgi:hypothetical protein
MGFPNASVCPVLDSGGWSWWLPAGLQHAAARRHVNGLALPLDAVLIHHASLPACLLGCQFWLVAVWAFPWRWEIGNRCQPAHLHSPPVANCGPCYSGCRPSQSQRPARTKQSPLCLLYARYTCFPTLPVAHERPEPSPTCCCAAFLARCLALSGSRLAVRRSDAHGHDHGRLGHLAPTSEGTSVFLYFSSGLPSPCARSRASRIVAVASRLKPHTHTCTQTERCDTRQSAQTHRPIRFSHGRLDHPIREIDVHRPSRPSRSTTIPLTHKCSTEHTGTGASTIRESKKKNFEERAAKAPSRSLMMVVLQSGK